MLMTSSWLFPPATREVQFDEKWSFVAKKQKNCDPANPADDNKGDWWDHVAYDPEHKLVLAVVPGARVTEMPVRHHARRFGESKYGLSRIWKVATDLISLKMLSSFRERPLLMFGVAALGAFLVAALFAALTGLTIVSPVDPRASYGYVFPSVALVLLSLAFFLLLMGLVGEVAIAGSRTAGANRLPVARECV